MFRVIKTEGAARRGEFTCPHGAAQTPVFMNVGTQGAIKGALSPSAGWTNIFIYPGYRFKVLDGLITNFHLPESTLIMLVSALAGRENVLAASAGAVREKYRFFSLGDAMFIS